MRCLVKANIKGPLGPAKPGEVVELDEKLGAAMIASGLVELVGGVQIDEPVEPAQQAPQEKLFSKKKKGK